MTNEEKDLLIAYLVDSGEIDPDGDVEAQFLDWYQVREGQVSGETHCKATLETAWVRKRSYRRGYRQAGDIGGLEGDPQLDTPSDRLAVGQEDLVGRGLNEHQDHVHPFRIAVTVIFNLELDGDLAGAGDSLASDQR